VSPAAVDDDAAAGFGGSVGWGRAPAVLVIDLARAYFTPGSDLHLGSGACLESAARVVTAARAAGLPVVHTRVAYAPGGVDGGLFFRKVRGLRHFVDGDPLGEPMPEVAPLPGELVVTKQYASGFFGTSLASTLTVLGVDTTVLVGVSTSGCVRATALDALQSGFRPVVVREAVGDRDPGPHEANLFDLQAKYADVLSEDEVVARLGPPSSRSDGPP
jgi:maleamate amidohydrolase